MAGPRVINYTTVPRSVGGGSCYFYDRDDSTLDARVRAEPAQSWAFDRWEVGTAGSTWAEGVWWSDSDDGNGIHYLSIKGADLNNTGPIEENVLRLQIVAVFRYTGAGTAPSEPQKVVVTVTQTGDGSGTVTGGGTYIVGASYTVSGVPSNNPLSVVTKIESSLGFSQTYSVGVGTTRSETATAMQDVAWTVTFRRVFKVGLLAGAIAGGAAAAVFGAINCTPSFSNNVGTTTDDGQHANRTLYLYLPGDTCTIAANPTYPAEVVRFRSDAGGNWDGQTQASFTVNQDTDIYVMCLFSSVNLTATAYTDGVQDTSGGTVSLSDDSDVSAGDRVTVTATVTAGTTVDTDGCGESSYRAGKSGNDSTVLEIAKYRNWLIQETTYAYATLTATVTIQGRNVRDMTADGNLPSWTGVGSAASSSDPKVWFYYRTEHLADAYFYTDHKDYEFEIRFDFKTYGSHGAAYLDNEQITSGQKFKISKTATRTLALRALTQWPYDDLEFFCYGIVQKLSGRRSVMYSYPASGGQQYSWLTIQFPPYTQVDGAAYAFDVWVWPRPTGKILYRQSDGAILRGSGGKPMAQYVD